MSVSGIATFAGLAIGLLAASPAMAAAPPATHSARAAAVRGTKAAPAVKNCGQGSPERKPSDLIVACADAGIQGQHLIWSKWGQKKAVAKGTFTWHVCVPYCAASKKWDKTAGTFTLEQPVDTPAGWLYEKLVVHVPGKLPAHMAHTLTVSEKPVPTTS